MFYVGCSRDGVEFRVSEAQLGGRGALGSLTTEGQAAEDGKRHDELAVDSCSSNIAPCHSSLFVK